MVLFTALVVMAVVVVVVFWWTHRTLKRRLPSSVEVPEIEPPEINMGPTASRWPIDPFSGEPLNDECELVVLEDMNGHTRVFKVNPDTAYIFGEAGLKPFQGAMAKLHAEPDELFCVGGKHKLGTVDEMSIAYLYDKLFGGYGGSFDNAFDDLATHWFRSAAEYGYEYKLKNPFRSQMLVRREKNDEES